MAEEGDVERTGESTIQTLIRHASRRPGEPGLDLICTKIAVDFQSIDETTADERLAAGLKDLTNASGVDCSFIALIDAETKRIDTVYSGRSPFSACNPDVLVGLGLAELPWIASRLKHLRLIELRDARTPSSGQARDAQFFAEHDIAAVLAVSFNLSDRIGGLIGVMSPVPDARWGADLQLSLKLLGASCASGLERIRLKEDLLIVRERDELVTNTANDGLWDYDYRSNRTFFSPRWRVMLGFEDEAEVPDWQKLVHPDDMARVQAQLREHLEGKTELFESIHRMRHNDGDWRWIQCRIKARIGDGKRVRRLVGVETDITERKLYEEALFREKESAQITLQSIGDGVATTDAEGNVQYLNPVAEGLTGWKLDDAVGLSIDEIFRGFHEETCEPVENPVLVAMRRSRSIKSVRPTLLIRRDGNELYIESTAAPIRDASGTVTGGALVFHDVTESRELNRRLSYAASHDILTELVNRTEFENRLGRSLKSARARDTICRALHRSRPVQDRQRRLRSQCRRSAAQADLGIAQVQDPLARHAGPPRRRRVRRPARKLHDGRGHADGREPARSHQRVPFQLG